MDFRAGLILVCMLFAQASCQPVGNKTTDEPLASAIKELKVQMRHALDHLSNPGLLPNTSCQSWNMTKLLKLEQQPLIGHYISTFRCCMKKFSEVIPQLSEELKKCEQYMQDMESWLTGQVVPKNCSLPTVEERVETLIHAKCFLELLQKTLTDSNL